MLWDVIRDFFVHYVFGGHDTDMALVECFYGSNSSGDEFYSTDMDFKFLNGDGSMSICIGDWLSTIATIITIVALVIACIMIIKKIFNICFNLFTGRSIF